jgi:hypothetical protein
VDRPLRAVRDRFWRRPARWAGALALALAAGAAAQPLVLLTEEEVAREAGLMSAEIVPRGAPRPGAPAIRVLAPQIGAEPLGNPIRIDLVFAAAPDAEIDPASFRVQYGALRLDLTERILARVVVDKTGLKVDNVVIPRGNHRLLLHIADTKARVGETELRFTVQ